MGEFGEGVKVNLGDIEGCVFGVLYEGLGCIYMEDLLLGVEIDCLEVYCIGSIVFVVGIYMGLVFVCIKLFVFVVL